MKSGPDKIFMTFAPEVFTAAAGQKDVMSDIPKLSNSREWRSHEKAFLAQWFMQLVTRKLYTC